MTIKTILSKIIRDKRFYPFWVLLNRFCLYGMNYEVSSGYADYSGELFVIRALKKYIFKSKDPVVFDVGANIGDWSKFVIDEYNGLDYKLYMFEPSKSTFKKLTSNIKESDKTKFFKMALGDAGGETTIYYDYSMQGSASILNDQNFNLSEDIRIETVDNFCKKESILKINFLKMDVQGYEFNVLTGAKEMIDAHNIDFIQFEFDSPNIENRIYFKDFYRLLSNEFILYKILFNGFVEIKEYHYRLETFMCLNYLAVRRNANFNIDAI